MSMPAIERVIPLVGQLPAAIREALARRLRELAGLGLLTLSGGAAAALMTWSVQDPSLSHATSRPIRNIARLSRRHRRRSPDADSRPWRDHADPADRGVGLAHADPSHLRPRSAAARAAGSCARCWRRALPVAGRTAEHGRCRPGLAASSATRWCARRPSCSVRPGSSLTWRSGPFSVPPWSRHSSLRAASARVRRKRN